MATIDHLILKVNEITSSVDFYVNVLGFELEGEDGPLTIIRVNNGSFGWRAVEGTDMERLILSGIALALILVTFTSARAQDPNDLMRNIEGALKERSPDWVCKKSPSGEPGPDSPHGTPYNFVCTRDQQSVIATIFLGDSKEDAVKLFELSQRRLQVDTSKPQEGIGEQAYSYAGHGFAWVTFRKGNVFAQVSVSLIDPRKVPGPSPEIDALTNQAWEIAKRLAQDVAQQTGATQNKPLDEAKGRLSIVSGLDKYYSPR